MTKRLNPEPQRISGALRFSPEWKAWEKEAYKKGWDWAETNDTGWMSDEHFAAFMDFVRSTVRVTKTKKTKKVEVVEVASLGVNPKDES